MIVEVTYTTGEKRTFNVDDTTLVIDFIKEVNQFGSVKKMEFV